MDTSSRRQALHDVKIDQTTHPGLWLDKYLKEQVEGGGENAKKPHFQEVAQYPVPAAYKMFFDRWAKSLDAAGAISQIAKAQGRLAIGLGGESVLETAITLHRTYGVPYIPGSALKGLAAHYAHRRLDVEWRKGSNAYNVLFGETAEAGYVTFFDALYIPGSSKGNRPLALDVITVHHPDYYQGKDSAPADWDSPIPVSFLSATGSYLIALHGAENWVKVAFKILGLALKEEGIGAKTSSGYGRMFLDNVTLPTKTTSPAEKEPYAVVKRRLLSENPPAGRLRGTLASLPKPNYGFINPARGGSQLFLHESQIRSGRPLREGQIIEYQIGQHKGRSQAQDVEILLEPEE